MDKNRDNQRRLCSRPTQRGGWYVHEPFSILTSFSLLSTRWCQEEHSVVVPFYVFASWCYSYRDTRNNSRYSC